MRFDRHLAALAVSLAALALGSFAPAAAAEMKAGLSVWTRSEIQLHRGGARPTKDVGMTLPAGTGVTLLRYWDAPSNRWWQVETASGTGWLTEKFLAETRPPDLPPPPPDEFSALPPEVTFAPPVAGEDRSAELAAYWKAIRNGSGEERMLHCQQLPYSGHDDPRFFDLLDGWLNARYERAVKTDIDVEADVTRCLQGLASSGLAKYQETLSRWSKSPQLGKPGRRFVLRAQVFLSESTAFNPIINKTDTHVEGRDWATTRVINMIQSGSTSLQREGMRRMSRNRTLHAAAFDALEQQLIKESASLNLEDGQRIDIVSWSCKTLALTHDRKYLPTLQRVSDTYADNFRLKRNCAGSIDNLVEPDQDESETADATP